MPLRSPAAILRHKCLGAALLPLAVAVFLSTGPARSADFTDSAGRRIVLPDRIGRIMPAEPNAEVLVFVLTPEKLTGLSQVPARGSLLPRAARLPVLGWRPGSTPASMADTARQLRPDLIIDAGTVTLERSAFADQVTRLTGIPYILVDDSFARMPKMLRTVAAILGVGDRHSRDLWLYAEHAIAGERGRLLIRPANARPHVYFARGVDGLATALPGSPAGESIDAAGAINVASPLGRGGEVTISREQLLGWDPEIIIAAERSFYDALRRSPAWRRLSAVRNKRVYLEPSNPFGWIQGPSGVNRLIGQYWLSNLFYPDATQEDLRATTCDFYDKFYRIKLTNAQLEAMVRPAGIPPAEVLRPVGEPLVGLPPSTGPYGVPGAPGDTPATAPSATCIVPTGPSPYQSSLTTTGASLDTLPPTGAPGVPPPGRRGRPQ